MTGLGSVSDDHSLLSNLTPNRGLMCTSQGDRASLDRLALGVLQPQHDFSQASKGHEPVRNRLLIDYIEYLVLNPCFDSRLTT